MAKRRLFLALSLMVLMILLFACRPVTDVEDPVDPDEPIRVVVAQAADVESWDPPVGWGSANQWITDNAYDWLFMRSGDGAEWVPLLAESWEVIDDVTVRFDLREGVKFHDGTELTAEDVKYHYRRIIDGTREEYIVQPQYTWIQEIIIHDPYTFDVVAESPDSAFMWRLAQTNTGASIVSKDYVEEVGTEGVHREPMGTGAWRLKEWVRDEHTHFVANEDYWRGRPNFDEFIFKVIPEPSTRIAELLTGGVDLTYGVMAEDQARLEADPDTQAFWAKNARGFLLWTRIGVHPNHVGEPELDREFVTEDPRIRKAVELALDKEALRDFHGGIGQPFRARGPYQPLPEGNPDLYGERANLYDPGRARELIEEAGYGPGEAHLVFHTWEEWPQGDLARVMQDMLEEVGFSIELILLDGTTMTSEVYGPRKTQELFMAYLGGQMNPVFATRIFESSEQLVNYGGQGAGSEELDQLLHKAWTEMEDEGLRNQFYHEATAIIAEERYVIGLFQGSELWGASNRIDYTPRFDNEIYGFDINLVE